MAYQSISALTQWHETEASQDFERPTPEDFSQNCQQTAWSSCSPIEKNPNPIHERQHLLIKPANRPIPEQFTTTKPSLPKKEKAASQKNSEWCLLLDR